MAEVISGTLPSTSSPSVAPAAEAWRALGRDSPAGKALFALYNGDAKGKSVGDAYHARNRQRHADKVAAGWTPPPKEASRPVIERPQVNYPKFGRDKHAKEVPFYSLPRRKPGDQIMAEMEADRQAMRANRPQPTGPLLDEREKERCAAMMRYRGKVPEVTAEDRAAAAIARGAREPVSERQELASLFQSIMGEIEERQEFLKAMEGAGKLTREMQHQLRNEIKQRVADLERLDRIINDREDSARATAGLPPR